MNNMAEIKSEIIETGRRMYEQGYVVANDGNISVRADKDTIWVTPAGVSKGYMNGDMLVRMTLDGSIVEGAYKPSSEVKMHLRVYRENPSVNAVVHAHPPIATAFAASGISLDETILSETAMLLGSVPLVPYSTPGTEEVPNAVAPYCNTHCALLLSNHGVLTWGNSPEQAYFRLEELEQTARIYLISKFIIKSPKLLTKEQIDLLPKFF
jgi:L-fuculose-phosphate aldolase